MIKSFAEKVDCEIPKTLQPHVIMGIHGQDEREVDLTIPIFPTGFSVIINVYGDMPEILHPNGLEPAPSTLNLAGQIYKHQPHVRIQGNFGQVGLLLHPMTTYYLFHKMGDFSLNRWVAFKGTGLNNIENLLHGLSLCENPLDRFPIIITYLEKLEKHRLAPIPWMDKAFEMIYASDGQLNLTELTGQLGVSLRHFRRKFKTIVGVPPKYFCKVIQLNRIFEAINDPVPDKLLHLALDYGYYDQAHFINDFKKLIGNSPERFLESEHSYVKTYLGKKGGVS